MTAGQSLVGQLPLRAGSGPADASPAAPPPPDDAGRPTGLFASSRLTAAMGLYVPATVVVRLINFARIIVLTWLMSTQQFGLLTMLLLVINVLTPLCSLGLTEAVTRYVPQHEARGTLYEFVRRALILITVVSTVAMSALVLLSPVMGMRFFGQFVYDDEIRAIVSAQLGDLTRLSAVVIGLLIFYFFVLAVLKGLRMIRALAVIELVHSLAFLALALAACWNGNRSAKTITACYGLSLLIALVVCGVGLSRALHRWTGQHRENGNARLYSRMLRFSQWAMISGFTWQVLQYYPAWYLNKVMGNDAVAVFGAVRQIGQFVLLGAITLVTVVMTAVTKTWETHGVATADRQLSLAFRSAGTLMMLACAALALGRDLIIRVYSATYWPGAEVLPLQLLFFLIGGNFAFIALHFNLIEKPRLHFLPYAVGVAANIVAAYWLVGGRLATLQASSLWVALEPGGSAIFVTGFSDRLGLGSASWAGVLAILSALLMCLFLLRSEGRRLDRGSYIVLAAALLLAANSVILLVGSLLFAWIAWRTDLVFSRRERRELVSYASATVRSLFRPDRSA